MNSFIIEREKIKKNVDVISERAGAATVIAVVKGNGYGFGLSEYISILHESGVRFFAVTSPADALKIRERFHDDTEILMLRSTSLPDEIASLIDNNVILTIGSLEAAVATNKVALSKNTIAKVHIKIDTGMGRYGFDPNDTETIYSAFTNFPSLEPCGLFTHLTSAFKNKKVTEAQIASLDKVKEELIARGIDCGTVHFANSSYLFKFPAPYGDAVRIGSAFTGRLPCKIRKNRLMRVGHIESNICELRWLSPGSKVGYSGAYTVKKATRIAILPIGYADGIHIEKARDTYRMRDVLFYILSDVKKMLSRKHLYATINGSRARILGHIGMTHTVCDVTDIPCNIGDIAAFEINPIYVSPEIHREFI